MSTKLILKKKLKNIIGKQKDNREIHDLLNVDVDQINFKKKFKKYNREIER